ncbi:MAG: SigE family RNA polymerase sigma factor [Actinomycetota bacterium]
MTASDGVMSFDRSTPRGAEPAATTPRARRRARRERERDLVLSLYEDHHHELVRFASFVAPEPGMAEDLVHEAFVKLYGAKSRLEDPAKVGAYLRTIVVNLSKGRARHLGVVRRNRPEPAPDAASAEANAMRSDTGDRVVAAIRRLSDRQRACLVLRHYEDRSESEIAEILGISIGSVRTHVHRGMERLAVLLHADAPSVAEVSR